MTSIETFFEERFNALRKGQYENVYRSYHIDSPFLQQFSDCDDYLDFAAQQLGRIVIKNWFFRGQRWIDSQQVECLLVMELAVEGQSQFFYECALLIQSVDGWRYHSAQKLGMEDFHGDPETITFRNFDQVQEQIRY